MNRTQQTKMLRKILKCTKNNEFEKAIVLQRKLLKKVTHGTNLLCRFRPNNDNTLKEITTGLMYCSPPKDFNDSFDSNFGCGIKEFSLALLKGIKNGTIPFPDARKAQNMQITNMEVLSNVVHSAMETEPHVDNFDWCMDYLETYAKRFNNPVVMKDIQIFKDIFKESMTKINQTVNENFLLGCLTINCYNQLMWSYYTNQEKGICIVYDFSNDEYWRQHSSLLPIIYAKKRPQVPWGECLAHPKDVKPVFEKIVFGLLTKAKAWEHEQEWRVIIPKENGPFYKLPPIKCIYLGNKIESDYKQKILDIARERNIPVYQMCLNSTTYTLVSREFKQ